MKDNPEFKRIISQLKTENDRSFCERVWQTDESVYKNRLEAVGFTSLESVLDAGCGFGQWTNVIGKLNQAVDALDFSEERVKVASELSAYLGENNVSYQTGSIEELPYDDSSFDGIFCYSVIFMVDYKLALKEFFRVLKPGGRVYICSNGIGFFLWNLVSQRNNTSDFDSSKWASSAIASTIEYLNSGERSQGTPLAIPSKYMVREMEKVGFQNMEVAGEGKINLSGVEGTISFYNEMEEGYENVYEVLGYKNI